MSNEAQSANITTRRFGRCHSSGQSNHLKRLFLTAKKLAAYKVLIFTEQHNGAWVKVALKNPNVKIKKKRKTKSKRDMSECRVWSGPAGGPQSPARPRAHWCNLFTYISGLNGEAEENGYGNTMWSIQTRITCELTAFCSDKKSLRIHFFLKPRHSEKGEKRRSLRGYRLLQCPRETEDQIQRKRSKTDTFFSSFL